MLTSAILRAFEKWEDVRAMVLEWHPNQADVRSPEQINRFHVEVYGESMIAMNNSDSEHSLGRIMFVNRSPTV
ncbi:hypothetical protein TNCV_1878401 [Trichonephila clavipes]|nr:hypothetical protein TNCV_1878401 [Trichonephila clavipes]